MFIEKEAATPAVVIQDTKVRQRLDNSHLAQAPEKKTSIVKHIAWRKKKGRTKTRTQIDGDRRETEKKPWWRKKIGERINRKAKFTVPTTECTYKKGENTERRNQNEDQNSGNSRKIFKTKKRQAREAEDMSRNLRINLKNLKKYFL